MSNWAIWIQAARPRTMPLALACIALGTLIAADHGSFNAWVLAATVLTATAYQILSNLANDLGDGLSGADAHRTGAHGVEQRAVGSGQVQLTQMRRAVQILTAISVFFTAWTVWIGTQGMPWFATMSFALLGLMAIVAARGYTLGWSYGYRGWGDVFVMLFFGPVGVVGSYVLQSHQWESIVFLPGLAIGLLAASVLNLNNMRDVETDRLAGKRTLALRMGLPMARVYQTVLILEAYIAATAYVFLQTEMTCSRSFLYLATLPLLGEGVYKMWKAKSPAAFDALLKPTALQSVLFALLLGLGLLIDANQCAKPLF